MVTVQCKAHYRLAENNVHNRILFPTNLRTRKGELKLMNFIHRVFASNQLNACVDSIVLKGCFLVIMHGEC